MPAPAIAFLGLLAAKKGIETGRSRKRNKAVADALDKFSGAGQLGHRGYGPPTDVGQGETQLTDQQILVTQALRETAPGQAFNLARQFAQENTQAEVTARNFAESDEDQEIRRDTLKLQQEQLAFGKRQFTIGQEVTKRDMERAVLAISDQRIGAADAIADGKETFGYVDPETGLAEVIPVRGTEGYNKQVKAIRSEKDLLEAITRLRRLNAVNGGQEVRPNSPVFAELEALEKTIQLKMKDVLELGALQGADFELIEGLAPDVNSIETLLFQSPEALEASYGDLSNRITAAMQRELEKTKNWQHISDDVRQSASKAAIEAAQPIQISPAASAAAAQVDAQAQSLSQGVPALGFLNAIGVSPQALIKQGQQAAGGVGALIKSIF